MMDRDWGSLDEMLIARAKLQNDAVGAAIKGGKAGYVGKTIEAIMDDPKLVNSAVMDRLRFQQKQVAGYWLADKMLDKGITGHKITKYLQEYGVRWHSAGVYGGADRWLHGGVVRAGRGA